MGTPGPCRLRCRRLPSPPPTGQASSASPSRLLPLGPDHPASVLLGSPASLVPLETGLREGLATNMSPPKPFRPGAEVPCRGPFLSRRKLHTARRVGESRLFIEHRQVWSRAAGRGRGPGGRGATTGLEWAGPHSRGSARMPLSAAALPRMKPTARDTVWSKEPRSCSTCWFRVSSWSRRGPRMATMSPRCPSVCRRAAFSDGGADGGGAWFSGRPGGEPGSSQAESGSGELGAWKGAWSSGRLGAGVKVGCAVGEAGAPAGLGGDELNLSVQAGSASGSRAAGSGWAPGTRSGW